jgi:L-fuculose-phosphate aldolase
VSSQPGSPDAPGDGRQHAVLRERIATVCRELGTSGLVVGAAGNVSARTAEGLLITPRGCRLSHASPDQLVTVPRGADPPARASSEIAIHDGIYSATDAGAVVHTHSHFATILSTVVDVVPPVHYSLAGLGGEVRVARYATFGTVELARNALDALGDSSAVLLRNHGAVAFGSTVEQALERALLLEWLCSIAFHAHTYGAPRELDREELEQALEQSRRLDYYSLTGT